MEIIELGPKETHRLHRGLMEFYKEGQIAGIPRKEVFDRNWFAFLRTGIGKIFLAVDGETELGAIGGIVGFDLSTGDLYTMEIFWFVFPEARNGVGLKLVKKFENWSREAGAKYARFSSRSCLGDKVPKLLERLGYNKEEEIFIKGLV